MLNVNNYILITIIKVLCGNKVSYQLKKKIAAADVKEMVSDENLMLIPKSDIK